VTTALLNPINPIEAGCPTPYSKENR
jgi:hypothetical protein